MIEMAQESPLPKSQFIARSFGVFAKHFLKLKHTHTFFDKQKTHKNCRYQLNNLEFGMPKTSK